MVKIADETPENTVFSTKIESTRTQNLKKHRETEELQYLVLLERLYHINLALLDASAGVTDELFRLESKRLRRNRIINGTEEKEVEHNREYHVFCFGRIAKLFFGGQNGLCKSENIPQVRGPSLRSSWRRVRVAKLPESVEETADERGAFLGTASQSERRV